MKKVLPIIVGIAVGIAISVSLIQLEQDKVAHGSITWWDTTVVAVDTFSWGDIFGGAKGQDVYMLVYDNLIDQPDRDAINDVASQYGLTVEEAQSVLGGSIVAIYNNPNQRSGKDITQEDAYIMLDNMQEDFAFLLEVYELQQEIDAAVTPSEMFANGDVDDSGFDLIYDLTVIEEILFLETTENSVGEPFSGQLDTPYLPTKDSQTLNNYVESDGHGATLGNKVSPLTVTEGDGEGEVEATVQVGDEEIGVDVLEKDVCPTDDPYAEALGAFVDENEGDDDDGDGDGDDDGDDDGDGDGDDDGDGDVGDGGDDDEEDEKKLEPAPADDWAKGFCPNISSAPSTSAFAGEAGFSSLGGIMNPFIAKAAGTGAAFNEGGLGAYISICLETEFVMESYSSYQPGESCVLCEVEKINDLMDETLSHSLVPNKATGNQMESAKCKDTGTALNFQFIAIAAPIPTPPNDDIILGKNIFAEWKRFVDKYEPFAGFDASLEVSGDFDLAAAPIDTTQRDLLFSVKAISQQKKAEALAEIESYEKGNEGSNETLYIQNTLTEMGQMNAFFKGYFDQYLKINELFPYFDKKETKG